jgi:predicted protein tyrosine phosphatase
MGLNRSKYVSEHLTKLGYETRYGGVEPCNWDPEPANPAKIEDIDWADLIIVMRKKHIKVLKEKYGVKDKRIINLDVGDSRKKASETHPEFRNIERVKFNKRWTYPKLEEELKKYLPLEA